MTDFDDDRERMIERHLRARGLDDPSLLAAFRTVPRELFVPEELRDRAYEDGPLPIGEEQTISQPFIVALMIDAADIGPGAKVLEVGAGSGYAAAVLSRMAGQVFAIERHEVLARQARDRLSALGYDNVRIIAGDGLAGLPDEAPFDAILVAARAPALPEALKRQVAPGGTIVIPVGGDAAQALRCYRRIGEEAWQSSDLGDVRFVPLLEGAVSDTLK